MASLCKNSGIALIMVLLLLTVLVALVGQFSYTIKIDTYIAENSMNDLQLRYALLAALNHAIAQLQLDAMKERSSQTKYDCLSDEWANPIWSEQNPGQLGEVKVYYRIVDENSKFNLLYLIRKKFPERPKTEDTKKPDDSGKKPDSGQSSKKPKSEDAKKTEEKPQSITPAQQFDRLGDALQPEEKIIDIPKLREAILDWMKEKRGKPDTAAAGPFKSKILLYSVREIGLAKDINPLILNPLPGIGQSFSDYLTVWSDAKININIASLPMLISLNPKLTPEIAANIVKYRDQIGTDGQQQAFQTIADFKKVDELGPEKDKLYGEIANMITVQSSYFSIVATATAERTTKKMHAIVLRKGKRVHKLFCNFD